MDTRAVLAISHRTVLGTILGLALLGLAALPRTSQAAEKRFDRDFQVTPGGTLTVDADSSDIVINGTHRDRVEVHIIATGSQSAVDKVTMQAQAGTDGVKVTVKRHFSLLGMVGHFDSKIQIAVPQRYNLVLGSAGGDISIAQLQGSVGSNTAGGDVRLASVTGNVKVRTAGGDIDVQDLTGDGELHTTGGDVTLHTVTGNSRVDTTGGDIRLEHLKGSVQASSGGGEILAADVRGDSVLKSTGGDIRAQGMDGRIEAGTTGGDITAELLGANRGIDAHTTGGDITLRLAADIKATLDASSTGGAVSSELPVTVTHNRESKLQGPINGGGPTIRARTLGGDIKLKTGR